jgi:hypothetical protein
MGKQHGASVASPSLFKRPCGHSRTSLFERSSSRVSLFHSPTSLLSSRNKHLSVQSRDRHMRPLRMFCFARTGLITRPELDLSPISAQWDHAVDATCGNQWLSFLLLELTGILIDGSILVIPAVGILKLNVSPRQRFQLFGVFEIGAV